MPTIFRRYLAILTWADCLLYMSAIIWALCAPKSELGTLHWTIYWLDPSFSDFDFVLTLILLKVTGALWIMYHPSYNVLVLSHFASQLYSIFRATRERTAPLLTLDQILSDLLLRICAAFGAIRFPTDHRFLMNAVGIELSRELVMAFLKSKNSQAYSEYGFWDLEQHLNYFLINLRMAGWTGLSWPYLYIFSTPPRLLAEVSVILWAIWRRSQPLRAWCFQLMFFELLLQTSAVFWAIWSPSDAIARRSYVSRVENIEKTEGVILTELTNVEEVARRRCDQRNQLLGELRERTSPMGLMIAIFHKPEGKTFEEACRLRAERIPIEFESLEMLELETQNKVGTHFRSRFFVASAGHAYVATVLTTADMRTKSCKELYDQTELSREAHTFPV